MFIFVIFIIIGVEIAAPQFAFTPNQALGRPTLSRPKIDAKIRNLAFRRDEAEKIAKMREELEIAFENFDIVISEMWSDEKVRIFKKGEIL